MPKITPITFVCACSCAISLQAAVPKFTPLSNNTRESVAGVGERFVYKNASGKTVAVPVAEPSVQRKLTLPIAKVDPHLSPALTRAATIAQERAHAHSKSRCWRYVKQALLAAGAIHSYPKTPLAKQAGNELVQKFGFTKLSVKDPYAAPVGAVLVYGGRGAGHVEIRNKTGFVSDFRAAKPSKRKLVGVYAKA